LFWDRRIAVGKTFDRVIEQELDAARCVIVLWSSHSIESEWVRSEAGEGAARGILHPVWIEDMKLPLEFRRRQTSRLVDWQPGTQLTDFDQLVADMGTLGSSVASGPARARGPSGTAAVSAAEVDSLTTTPGGSASQERDFREQFPRGDRST